jgi:hypothetical protein
MIHARHGTADLLEISMYPGMLSAGGFLGKNECLYDVLRVDDEIVRRLGVTHEKIAERIAYFVNSIGYPSRNGKILDKKYLAGGTAWRGTQSCPWGDSMPNSSVDLYVRNQSKGEQIDFPGGIVHLILKHHFYEGKGSPYRVDPEKAVRILEIE